MSGPVSAYTPETLSLVVEFDHVDNAGVDVDLEQIPVPTVSTIETAVSDGAITTGDFVVTLPENYTGVGEYYYTLTESSNKKVGGVTYDNTELTLKVQVTNGESGGFEYHCAVYNGNEKVVEPTITNAYAGGVLKISKAVAGNLGDQNKYFDFTVKLTPADSETDYPESFAVSGSSYGENPTTIDFDENGYTFKIRHGETLNIELPNGVGYEITEAKVGDYTTTVNGEDTNSASGTINGDVTQAFVNTKGAQIDTGITTDNLPYIVLMGIVVLAGVAMIAKRRMAHND